MRIFAATVAAAAATGTAHADIVDLMIFEIIATNEVTGATQSQSFTIDPGAGDGSSTVSWSLDQQLDFEGIGGLESASITVTNGANRGGAGGQSVVADFSVFASTQNALFQINSAVVSFATIPAASAQGFASAAVTLVDVFGDGAALTPSAGGGYRAELNNGATSFASLFPAGTPLSVAAGVGAGDFNADTGVFLPTGIDVSSISASWDFALSGFDSATGTSTFTVIPAPASAALLGLGGLAMVRRRR